MTGQKEGVCGWWLPRWREYLENGILSTKSKRWCTPEKIHFSSYTPFWQTIWKGSRVHSSYESVRMPQVVERRARRNFSAKLSQHNNITDSIKNWEQGWGWFLDSPQPHERPLNPWKRRSKHWEEFLYTHVCRCLPSRGTVALGVCLFGRHPLQPTCTRTYTHLHTTKITATAWNLADLQTLDKNHTQTFLIWHELEQLSIMAS